jgi:hypothetical protein
MKVKVRIAVAVCPNGDWNSSGWHQGTDEEKMDLCIDSLESGEARYWVTAELDVPETVEVAGEVEKAA